DYPAQERSTGARLALARDLQGQAYPTTGVSRWAELPLRSSHCRSQRDIGALAAAVGAGTGPLLQPLAYASGWLKALILTLTEPSPRMARDVWRFTSTSILRFSQRTT
ncbi:MAG: hypothetical protein L0387_21135, partial [Acidobacteria bacterium]|nr:hypothetical protein [Acidobacteriota bacterium]